MKTFLLLLLFSAIVLPPVFGRNNYITGQNIPFNKDLIKRAEGSLIATLRSVSLIVG